MKTFGCGRHTDTQRRRGNKKNNLGKESWKKKQEWNGKSGRKHRPWSENCCCNKKRTDSTSYSPSQNKVNMHRNNVCVGQTTANNQFSYSYDFFSVWMSFLILICKFSLHPSLSYISTFQQLSGHFCLKPYPRLQINISIMEAYYLHYQTWSSPNDFFFFPD